MAPATPQRRPINEEFSDRYDPNVFAEPDAANTNERGVQNSQITYLPTGRDAISRTKERKQKNARMINPRATRGMTESAANTNPIVPLPKRVTRLFSYGTVFVVQLWASFLSIFATAFGLFVLNVLGAVVVVESTFGVGNFADIVGDVTGWFDRDEMYSFFYIFLCIYYVIIFIMYWSCYKMLTFAGLKPLDGRMSAFKYTTFILSLIISIIPGGTIVPTILIWLWFVAHYPN